jgi:hypothetical protein
MRSSFCRQIRRHGISDIVSCLDHNIIRCWWNSIARCDIVRWRRLLVSSRIGQIWNWVVQMRNSVVVPLIGALVLKVSDEREITNTRRGISGLFMYVRK